jgi:hypothetical protein
VDKKITVGIKPLVDGLCRLFAVEGGDLEWQNGKSGRVGGLGRGRNILSQAHG